MSVEPGKWGVIYNPKAGTRKVQKRWKEIKEYMDSKGVNYDYVQSEGFGSVERLAKILANNGYRTIVIVGGDGALNDAINGIMLSDAEDKENIALGMIPNGIGNDFAKYRIGSLMVRTVTQGEEAFTACQSRFPISAHADTAWMGVKRCNIRVQRKFIWDQILKLLMAKCRIAYIHPVTRNDTFDGVMV